MQGQMQKKEQKWHSGGRAGFCITKVVARQTRASCRTVSEANLASAECGVQSATGRRAHPYVPDAAKDEGGRKELRRGWDSNPRVQSTMD